MAEKRTFTRGGAAAHRAGVRKRGQQISAAADARARALAPVICSIIADGYVLSSEIAQQLTVRGESTASGSRWTSDRARIVLQRIVGLGLITLPNLGPYGTTRYSGIARYSDVDSVRKANIKHANTHALALAPTLIALQAQGFTKPEALASELNRRSIAPQRGDAWTSGAVRSLLIRLDDITKGSVL